MECAFIPHLWVIAVVFFGVGDMATTSLGLMSGQVVEASPVVAYVISQFGLVAILPLKVTVFVTSYIAWRSVPDPYAIGVPVGLVVIGVVVTGWNTFMLYTVTGSP